MKKHTEAIGIVNASDISLSSVLKPLRSMGAKDQTVLFIDAQQSESVFDQSFSSKKKRGFWDVVYKKSQLKHVLLQASPGFYLMPRGKYVEKPRHLSVLNRLYAVLEDKFDRLVIHYPSKENLWQPMVMSSKTSQVLLILREDYRLYSVVVPANHVFRIQEVFSSLEREL